MLRWSRVFLPVIVGATLGCSAQGFDNQATCVADSQCESGLCMSNRCVALHADEDGDGLTNLAERIVGSNAFLGDTDADGIGDAIEVGGDPPAPHAALDSDADGVLDVFESAVADADLDCLPDQYDATDSDGTAQTAPEAAALRELHCDYTGVCGTSEVEVVVTCDEGVPTCAYAGPIFETIETLCDGLDNDCDGLTDEDLPMLTTGPEVLGECVAQKPSCVDGVPQELQPGHPSDEICNGKDDDCDGVVDNDLQIGQPCDGLGVCTAGVYECDPDDAEGDGDYRVCSTSALGSQYFATIELCNALDDDCDGEVDEDFGPVGPTASCGECGGYWVCAADQLSTLCTTDAFVGSGEDCDGIDNDCDGLTDEQEDLDATLAGCPTLGVCATPGTTAASCFDAEDGTFKLVCTPTAASPWEPGTELTCDGQDNDCDGLTDESFTYAGPEKELALGQPCGFGKCDGGVVQCATDGKGAVCSSLNQKEPEICNDIDDDCDGDTDEGMTWNGLEKGDTCEGTGQCGAGTVSCHPETGATTCSTDADGVDSQAVPEVCNLLDDDCDGETDELDDVKANQPNCLEPGVCATGQGVTIGCVDGVIACDLGDVDEYEKGDELTCDSKDNDCDGLVDELLAKTSGSSWALQAAGTPPPRVEMVAAWAPGQGVVLVGGDATTPTPDGPKPAALTDTWVYKPGTQTWDERFNPGPPPRAGATVVNDPTAGAGRMILFGGQDPQTGALLKDLHELDIKTWQWSAVTAVEGSAAARVGHAAVVDPETGWMWVIGGTSEGLGDAVVAFDLPAGKWVPGLPKGPGWREGVAAVLEPGGVGDEALPSRLVVFGGQAPDGSLPGDTWVLSVGDSGWTPFAANATGAPPPRRDHRMAYHDAGAWLFGGVGGSAPLGDLWRFDLESLTWAPLALADGPPPRRSPAFVGTEDGLLVLGGSAGGEAFTDAWLLKTAPEPMWQALSVGQVPTPRSDAFMAVESPGQLLMFGGVSQSLTQATALGDVWRLDGTKAVWTQISDGGPARARAAVAWDAGAERLLVHGGYPNGQPGEASTDLWTRAGGKWQKSAAQGLPALAAHAAAWDTVNEKLLLVGGLLDGQPSAGLWRIDLNNAKVEQPEVSGQIPPPVSGHVLCVDGNSARAILAAGAGAEGGLYALDLATYEWELKASVPSMAVDRPVVLLEPNSDRLLLGAAATGKPAFWEVHLDSGVISKLEMGIAPTSLDRTSAAFDPLLGSAFLFGGIDTGGHARNALWSMDYVCE